MSDLISQFYLQALPGAEIQNNVLQAPCPFCSSRGAQTTGTIKVLLNPKNLFRGYFFCSNNCVPSGFPLYFARLLALPLSAVPGYEPDREYIGHDIDYPIKNINQEVTNFAEQLTEEQQTLFQESGISTTTLKAMQIGFNGRYLVYPYFQPNGNCYSARCVHPLRPEDNFWYGDEQFSGVQFHVFNAPEIDRCENGVLFLVEGEKNLLPLKQVGYPGIAISAASDLEFLDPRRLQWVRVLFLWMNNNAESMARAREFATKVGFKVRLVRWPEATPRNAGLIDVAAEHPETLGDTIHELMKGARAFSPFPTPDAEFQEFQSQIQQQGSDDYARMITHFPLLDNALGGVHGINIIGGSPKAGKSTFCIQLASEMARHHVPVLYYDFENGRQKIYLRTLCRLSRVDIPLIVSGNLDAAQTQQLQQAQMAMQQLFFWLRVVNDRTLSPEIMRRHIDFIRHETNSPYTVVVVDSLHKLPFKDITQKRSGIDGWLRQLEAIRDEMSVSFLVISELERGPDGQFERIPQLGSFKGSGDIGYSADNAMVLVPAWDPMDNISPGERTNELWLVASREHSPGCVATYRLDYPYWGFIEEKKSSTQDS